MPMTVYVEEAKASAKICPHLPVDTETEHGDSPQITKVRSYAQCWGARCMMWRWARTHINNPNGGDMVVSENTHGFCGLAGIPGASAPS